MYCRYCGKELPDDAKFCTSCGKSVSDEQPNRNMGNNNQGYNNQGYYNQNYYDPRQAPYYNDQPNAGWGVLGFFFPLIGFILYLVWMTEYPNRSKMCGKGALIGVIVGFVLVILYIILVVVLIAAAPAYVPYGMALL